MTPLLPTLFLTRKRKRDSSPPAPTPEIPRFPLSPRPTPPKLRTLASSLA